MPNGKETLKSKIGSLKARINSLKSKVRKTPKNQAAGEQQDQKHATSISQENLLSKDEDAAVSRQSTDLRDPSAEGLGPQASREQERRKSITVRLNLETEDEHEMTWEELDQKEEEYYEQTKKEILQQRKEVEEEYRKTPEGARRKTLQRDLLGLNNDLDDIEDYIQRKRYARTQR